MKKGDFIGSDCVEDLENVVETYFSEYGLNYDSDGLLDLDFIMEFILHMSPDYREPYVMGDFLLIHTFDETYGRFGFLPANTVVFDSYIAEHNEPLYRYLVAQAIANRIVRDVFGKIGDNADIGGDVLYCDSKYCFDFFGDSKSLHHIMANIIASIILIPKNIYIIRDRIENHKDYCAFVNDIAEFCCVPKMVAEFRLGFLDSKVLSA